MPPLNWLRAFEAAARHLSLTRAAEELNVTQAAVSRHVKALEERLAMPLFIRSHSGLVLTDAGQLYFPRVRAAFDLLDTATRELFSHGRQGALVVRVPSSFSIQWLVPRLDGFYARHPDIEIRLTALDQRGEITDEGVDMEVRYGDGRWAGLEALLLMKETVFPVCSPELLRGEHPLRGPADLARYSLLHVTGYPDYREDWPLWLREAGVDDLPMQQGHAFDQSVMAVQAAVNGQGVALGRSPLVALDLAGGRLVAPFDIVLQGVGGYWVVYSPAAVERPKIVAFRDWLLEEALA
jgi:LysR family glycine cleavage system transcriptional activator